MFGDADLWVVGVGFAAILAAHEHNLNRYS